MRELFEKVRQNCMKSQFSWDLAAQEYIQVYQWAKEGN